MDGMKILSMSDMFFKTHKMILNRIVVDTMFYFGFNGKEAFKDQAY
jgi:hypothetical protein